MLNIIGHIVEEDIECKIDDRYTVYPITLCSKWDKRTLYSIKKEERKMWIDSIRNVLKYSDIYKTFELGVLYINIIFLINRNILEKDDMEK